MNRTIRRLGDPDGARLAAAAVVGFSLIAAAISALRAIRTDRNDGSTGMLLASMAALLAIAAAATAVRSLRWSALPLGTALALEVLVLDRYAEVAPPRLITMIPLMFALAVALVPGRSATARQPWPESRTRTVATTIALMCMVPIGFAYLATGLIAPAPDLFAAYVLFGLLLGGAVWLARRRSWWVVAVPIISAGLWPLMVWAGETYLDWQA